MSVNSSLENLAINTIRFLAVESIQKANSGHPGMPMGCSPIAFSLYTKFMKHNPANPKWLNRDRFILSAGHGSMLLYSILHLCGYDISLEQIKNFRQWKSITPGHPEFNLTPGVETTTGPLGQGFSNAVGIAISQAFLADKFNKDNFKILDHFVYGICGDGDLMEGISHEAASLAGHLKLGKLIFFYDDNGITIDGETNLAFSENIGKRFESYNWHVENIFDVNDLSQIETAILKAQKDERPSLIISKTHIGFGSPNKQDKESAHGSPLGTDEIKLTKKNLGWIYDEPFSIPSEVQEYFNSLKNIFTNYESDWNILFKNYQHDFPDEAKEFINIMNGNFGNEWKTKIPSFADDGKKIATRQASGKILNAVSTFLPTLLSGSADLFPSTSNYLNNLGDFSSANFGGRNFHYGIREHTMAGILNGMSIYGGVIPIGATFLVFSDYLRPSVRLAAMSGLNPIYIFTHDSIGLGEDGPTHQPIEHLAALRSIPKLIVIRPADANETAAALKFAIEHSGSPTALILTRQSVPILDQTKYSSAQNLYKGGYVLKDCKGKADLILMASGSEVHLIISASEILSSEGINVRVVSFPSWELFNLQNDEYKNLVLPKDVKIKISVEAGVSQGWDKFIGENGKSISIEKYGASAPEKILFENYGFTVENIIKVSKEALQKI